MRCLKRIALRHPRLWLAAILGLALCGPSIAIAGNLKFYDTRVIPGDMSILPAPAINTPIDLNVVPVSAEGNGFYGFSELTIWTTGDVTLEAHGFDCEATGCLYSPVPFQPGIFLTATGSDDLDGDFAFNRDVLTFSVSGTTGFVAIVGGEYIDATGSGGDPGNAQNIALTPIAQVPEPNFACMLGSGCLLLLRAAILRRRAYAIDPTSATD